MPSVKIVLKLVEQILEFLIFYATFLQFLTSKLIIELQGITLRGWDNNNTHCMYKRCILICALNIQGPVIEQMRLVPVQQDGKHTHKPN